MPKVSVLMPAYNSEKYIAEAIESILNQTFSDFEFIIINDGSTDKTAEIVDGYARADKRIKFINNKKNQGLIAVLNQGLDLCRGEYIARMDSDDIAINDRLEKQVAYLDANPHVGAVGGWRKKFGPFIKDKIEQYPEHVTFVGMLVGGYPMVNPGTTIRKRVLDENNLRYDHAYLHAEDFALWFEILKHAEIHNLPHVVVNYRWHDSNISVVSNKKQSETDRKIRCEITQYLTTSVPVQLALQEMAFETIKRWYLFGLQPINRKKQYGITKTKYYLFEKIPLLKVQEKKIYLFEFIKIGRIA